MSRYCLTIDKVTQNVNEHFILHRKWNLMKKTVNLTIKFRRDKKSLIKSPTKEKSNVGRKKMNFQSVSEEYLKSKIMWLARRFAREHGS